MYNVRVATEEDIFEVMVLAFEFSKESPSFYKNFNKDKVRENLIGVIKSDNTEVFVLECDKEIIGFIIGMTSELMFSDIVIATELAWFVTKSKRGSTASLRLIKAYEQWAIEKGVDVVTLGDLSELQQLGKIYKRMGYSLSETSYAKEV